MQNTEAGCARPCVKITHCRASHPEATSMRHQCDIKATSMRVASQAVATPKPPPCVPHASPMRPSCVPHASPMRPPCVYRAPTMRQQSLELDDGRLGAEVRGHSSEVRGWVRPPQFCYGGWAAEDGNKECRMPAVTVRPCLSGSGSAQGGPLEAYLCPWCGRRSAGASDA